MKNINITNKTCHFYDNVTFMRYLFVALDVLQNIFVILQGA